jgi:hypothetical protein
LYYGYGMNLIKRPALLVALVLSLFGLFSSVAIAAPPPDNPQNGSVGLQGEIPSKPPTQGATITVPGNGQNFSSTPITVAGVCPTGLLVEIYKNNVFSGSTNCTNGSFSLQIDLFDGRNDLVARVYDNLNQPGPDSNTVSVNFNANKPTPGPRISLTSAYAKRGAVPGTTLSWPITLSGGAGPYAISVDWGDKSPADLISRSNAGDITLEHIYKNAGFYIVIIKATDVNGEAAFLQVVGVGNGPTQQSNQTQGSGSTTVVTKIIYWPLVVGLVLTILAFWLGRRHKVEEIRARLRKGLKPF